VAARPDPAARPVRRRQVGAGLVGQERVPQLVAAPRTAAAIVAVAVLQTVAEAIGAEGGSLRQKHPQPVGGGGHK